MSLLSRLIEHEVSCDEKAWLHQLLSELEMVLQSKAAAPVGAGGEDTILQYGIQLERIDGLPLAQKQEEIGRRLLEAILAFEPRMHQVRLLEQQQCSAGMTYSFVAAVGDEDIAFSIVWNDALDSAAIRP
ncbi:hypothetical protein NP522_11600 [Pseudomonas guariconensis]|uniref:hypothetical protein n=1 Tax=Pseudomonas TaxID=286 RepID=UPI0008A14ABA|nr:MULTISPECIES: hypothetical protein [Pseudomonas]MDD2090839.1 hypothetical protein [Pseudomonas guariconensis]OFS73636.1 hypothetical protein HMPREF3173_11020 [Pseudomonas sp. HMSC08G10]